MFDFSVVQIVIVLVIALLVFGPKRLPEIARSVGKGISEFRASVSGDPAPPRDQTAPSSSVAARPSSLDSGGIDPVRTSGEEYVRRGDDQPAPPQS